MRTRICDMLDIEFPIFAFSHCRDVVAAVSKAGGMGVLGALAFSEEQLKIELAWIDEHVDGKPYGVDVVMPASYVGQGADASGLQQMIPEQHRKFVEALMDRFDLPELPEGEPAPVGLLGWGYERAVPQVDIALAHPIKLLASALGPPPPEVVERAHRQGVLIAALVGRADQAVKQKQAGTDIIVAQGYEAGGHTGEIATMVLIPEVVEAVSPAPVLAAGGIGSGRQMAAALALGADGVWTGSIWLTTKESNTGEAVMEKLLKASSRDTVRSRALTGKPARQLRTAWTDAWEAPDSPGTLPMPLQYMLTAEAQRRIGRYGQLHPDDPKGLLGTPVGQIVGRMKSIPSSRDVVYNMVEEAIETLRELGDLLGIEESAR
jgi:NAD(P)H-dependent flavin oxidoreductase YrpB (nitropropane dioxygenase family)